MKQQLRNIILFCGVLLAIGVRMMHPVQFKIYATYYEIIAALTILTVFVDGVIFRNITPKATYSIIERVCFIVFAFFETLNYIYFKGCSLHDWNLYMAVYFFINLSF